LRYKKPDPTVRIPEARGDEVTRIIRISLFLLCLLTAFSSHELLSRLASGLAPSYPSEQTRLAVHALFEYAATPLSIVLILLGLVVLIGPRAVSLLDEKRLFSPPPSSSDRRFLAVALLACFGASLALNVAGFRDFKVTPDENTYLNQARIFSQGKLYGEAPPVPEFFEEPYLAHKDGRIFSIYQPGWSLLLTPAVLMGLERAIPPLTASLALVAVFLLARTLYGSGVARAAALIMLFSPYFLFHAATYYSHIAELLWISLFALAFVTGREQKKSGLYLIAGLCLAAGFLTRYFALFFGFPFGLLLVWDLLRREEGAWKNVFLFVSPLLAAAGIAVVYQWILTGDPLLAPHDIYIEQARYIYILAQLENPYQLYGFSPDYTLSTALVRGLKRWWSLNFWVFPMAMLFVVPVLLRPKRWDLLFLSGFLCQTLVYLPYFPPGGWQYGPRYYFPVFGCLALIIARGLQEVFRYVRERWGTGRIYRGLAYGLCLCLVFNVSVTLLFGAGTRLATRGALDQYRLLEEKGIRAGIVLIRMHPDFYAHKSFKELGMEEELRNDYPYYLIHNRVDYGQDILFAHSLGEEEDRRLRAAFPDRRFYVFRANPFAAAFGIGRGELEEIGPAGGPN
jgi:4-amino-4-deoxy-L-arabinose transferase-like glycosyltransferase